MRGGPRSFPPGFTCPVVLWCHLSSSSFRVRDCHPLRSHFPERFRYENFAFMMIRNPRSKLLVWACPISLAATLGIEVSFSSSRYLDVSVPWVSFITLWIHVMIHTHSCMWVAPFGDLRVNGYLLLTAAYRSLSRPSSAPSAKASALCSSSLDLSDYHQ